MIVEDLSIENLKDSKQSYAKLADNFCGNSFDKNSDEKFMLSTINISLLEICEELKRIRMLLEHKEEKK